MKQQKRGDGGERAENRKKKKEKKKYAKHSIYGGIQWAITESVDNGRKINVDYFYRLLCTMKPMGNMNLVHEDCHPESHPGRHVDPDQIIVI